MSQEPLVLKSYPTRMALVCAGFLVLGTLGLIFGKTSQPISLFSVVIFYSIPLGVFALLQRRTATFSAEGVVVRTRNLFTGSEDHVPADEIRGVEVSSGRGGSAASGAGVLVLQRASGAPLALTVSDISSSKKAQALRAEVASYLGL